MTASSVIDSASARAPEAPDRLPRRNIALVGHACAPHLGSENGFTWSWAKHLSAYHDVTVFTHPEHESRCEAARIEQELERVRFHFVRLRTAIDPWRPPGERFIRFHYQMWQREVLRHIRALHHENPFDLVHHVSWGSLNQPPLLWKLGLPFVWGPVGGGQTWPQPFMQYARKPRLIEHLRTFTVRSSIRRRALRACARHADLVLATNRETRDLLQRAGAQRVEMFLDSGSNVVDPAQRAKPGTGDELTILWAGRLEHRKALPLALEAMQRLQSRRVRLLIAGRGPCQAQLQSEIQTRGLQDRVSMLGFVEHQKMADLFRKSDLFLFTSLRDSMGSVVLEAMSYGLPVITLDHQGAGYFVRPEEGVKIPVTDPPSVIQAIAGALDGLDADRPALAEMSAAVIRRMNQNTWSERALRACRYYEQVLSRRGEMDRPQALAAAPS